MKKTFQEFKQFIAKGNIIDMAIGVIMGQAFGKIVTSIVENIITPLIGLAMGGVNFSSLSVSIKDANIAYGVFIQNVIDFLIVALCLFVMLKTITILARKRKKAEEEAAQVAPPAKSDEAVLLEEIRDLLKDKEN